MASGGKCLGSAVYNARDDAHRAEHWPGCEIATRPGARDYDCVDGVLVGDGNHDDREPNNKARARQGQAAAGSEGGPAPRATYAVPRGSGDAWGAPPTILGILPGAALACGSPPPRD